MPNPSKKPTRKHEWKDQYTLLCESCGYILETLNQSLPCPECGKPITESLPQRRTGTPYQQKPTIRNLIKTWRQTLVHPIQTFDQIRFHNADGVDHASWSLLTTLTTGAGLIALPAIFVNPVLVIFIFFIALFPVGISLMLSFLFLTWITSLCLRFFARQRDARISRRAAWVILSHACVGWTITVLCFTIGFWTSFYIPEFLMTKRGQPYRNKFTLFIELTAENSILLGSIFGLLTFGILACIGFQRCKYANTLRPQTTPKSALPNEPRP